MARCQNISERNERQVGLFCWCYLIILQVIHIEHKRRRLIFPLAEFSKRDLSNPSLQRLKQLSLPIHEEVYIKVKKKKTGGLCSLNKTHCCLLPLVLFEKFFLKNSLCYNLIEFDTNISAQNKRPRVRRTAISLSSVYLKTDCLHRLSASTNWQDLRIGAKSDHRAMGG